MSHTERTEIAVIGAGAVGIACALWLRQRGYDVTVLEREGIASGASFGNASTFAVHGSTPIARPDIWSNAPQLLFSPDSPFVINWSRLPRLTPWLIRFLGQCNKKRFLKNSGTLAQLLGDTYGGYAPLLEETPDAQTLINRRGCLYSFRQAANLRAAHGDIELRDKMGIHQQRLNEAEVAELEPAMEGHTKGGILFTDSSHLDDPEAFIRALSAPLRAEGRVHIASVTSIKPTGQGLSIGHSDGQTLLADKVVVASGAWSATLARQVGDRIPLDTERGYHIEFDLDNVPVSRPTCPVENAFYMTPLQGRLRAAGTVELGSIRDPANPKRLRYIEQHVRHILNLNSEPARTWLGFRPSLPDSLPVIGPSPREPRLIYAFGHQHLGLTLAGATGRLVADCLAGQQPDWLKHCSAGRF
ncbi:FAD-binding oxidoreductase [uncultured Marinobacter sp.]|uniref:NAD(P)/FAD-dependent oxidoreductase n=1 Tax=uncultured Marinobacter sp. TaxID=187379 RepID=UPI00260C93C6|nr:FAD-binding oxidoreductase [uncultured Marinobacter sp.]